MTSTYYTSLSGMVAASYGLKNTSNNISNMQSAGYKRTDIFYRSLGNGAERHGLGSGVYIGGQSINFSAGNYQSTGSPSDLAVVGNGFFIVKLKNGELLYTRNGQFGFNSEGLLIDKASEGLVQGYDKQGGLVPISQFGSKINPGKETNNIKLKGQFIISELKDSKTETDYEANVFNVTVFDSDGKKHQLELRFEAQHQIGNPNKENEKYTWTLTNIKYDGVDFEQYGSQEIEFESNGQDHRIKTEKNQIKIQLQNMQNITLDFGTFYDDAYSSVLIYNKKDNPDKGTDVEEKSQDGYAFGRQIDFSFDDNGQITYKYNNDKSEEGTQIALAMFDDIANTLTPAHDNLFRARHTNGLHLGRANKELFGTIQPGKLESSNVDSTTEFANIVVLQRMFQACSQIMDIDKQLLEDLYKR